MHDRLIGQTADRETVQTEGWRRRKDGSEYFARSVLVRIDDEEERSPVGYWEITRDVTDSVKRDRRLRDNEWLLSQIADAVPFMLYIYDVVNQRNIYVNERATELTGYTPAQIQDLGSDLYPSLMHPEDLHRISTLHHHTGAILGDKDVIESEYRLRHANGEWRWFASRDIVFKRNDDGTTRLVLGTAEDITARKQEAEALHLSEEKFRQIFDHGPIGIVFGRQDGSIALANHAFLEMLGYAEGELSRLNYAAFTHPDDLPTETSLFTEMFRGTSNHYQLEKRYIRKTGETIWVNLVCSLVRDSAGSPSYAVGLVENITARKEAQDHLHRSLDFYLTLFDRFPVLVWRTDATGACDYVNGTWREFSGRALEQELGYGWTEVLHPDDRERCVSVYHAALERREPFEMEYRLRRRDGVYRWMANSGSPYQDLEGRFAGYIGACTDISERINFQAERVRTAHLTSLGELAAGVAHEINNPINGIIACAQLLQRKTPPENREFEMLSRIVSEGDRIAAIVRSLLAFARQRAHEREAISLREVILDSLALAEAQLRKDGITITTAVPDTLARTHVNPQQIQQVILNIISNARYALNEKTFRNPAEKKLVISSEELGSGPPSHVRLRFRDNGTGIKAEHIDKIMNPFFTTKPNGVGTGLGLSICHSIVTEHGGQLSIESVEGDYTEVALTLPAWRRNGTKSPAR